MSTETKDKIYHITTREAWLQNQKAPHYIDSSLEKEGFIHCSYIHQLLGVTERYFKGQKDLLILEIQRDKTKCTVIDEDLLQRGEAFPHIYGPIPHQAILQTFPLLDMPDGCFALPDTL